MTSSLIRKACGGAGALCVVAALESAQLDPAFAACTVTGTNQTCSNSATISGANYGIQDTGSLTLTVNNGSISGDAIAGVAAAQDILISTNNGTIASVNGVGVSAGDVGKISNTATGVISGNTGISLVGGAPVSLGPGLFNSGKITGTGSDAVYLGSDSAVVNQAGATIIGAANGINVVHDLNLINAGTITGAGLSGVVFGPTASGAHSTIHNDSGGTITGFQAGISGSGDNAGVYNAGTISASNGTGVSVSGLNFQIDNNVGGSISGVNGIANVSGSIILNNQGAIAASGSNAGWAVYASGGGAVTNSGTITSDGGGINSPGSSALTVINTGSISGGGTSVVGIGIRAVGALVLTNSGSITTSGAIGTAVFAGAGSTITNNASGVVSGASGISITGNNSTITNAGTISGSMASITYVSGSTGHVLNVLPSAVFNGAIHYNNTIGNTINFGTGSYTLPVDQYLVASNTINLSSSAQTLVTSGLNGAGTGNIVVTNVSNVASTPTMVPDFTRSLFNIISGILDNNIDYPQTVAPSPAIGYADGASGSLASQLPDQLRGSGNRLAMASMPQGSSLDAYGNLFWARSFAGLRNQLSTPSAAGSTTNQYGGLIGFDRRLDTWRVGGFAGAGNLSGWMADGSGTLKSDVYFGGLYGRREWGPLVFDLALATGGLNARSTRTVYSTTTESAVGSFGGYFIAPQAALGYRYAISPAVTVTPFVRVGYSGTFSEGYSETGSSQNLTYQARQVHLFEERAGAIFSREFYAGGAAPLTKLSLSASVFGQQRVGPQGFGASFSGTDFTVNYTSAASVFGGTVGLGFETIVARNTALFGSADAQYTNDKTASYNARLGLKVGF
ncbi:autotransporter domain-containing protein [Bradyrhizobium liaoningense]|uniref:autotransporter outer membrane beta-barrel domain-containing protein n=1 Tax=Bradyrhizobium liaoningense TaxID=43992 RepID=UPI001BAAE842|nr:autotransporter domain-containing protein [Bradyrhizobium liaoningense]MBR0712567.1 autotransporter domain-containing protein [Bradyrhizobium liaoningense]